MKPFSCSVYLLPVGLSVLHQRFEGLFSSQVNQPIRRSRFLRNKQDKVNKEQFKGKVRTGGLSKGEGPTATALLEWEQISICLPSLLSGDEL